MAEQADVQEGMRLRNRQLPGAVPVVNHGRQMPERQQPTMLGTVRRKISDMLSALSIAIGGSQSPSTQAPVERTPMFLTSTPLNPRQANPEEAFFDALDDMPVTGNTPNMPTLVPWDQDTQFQPSIFQPLALPEAQTATSTHPAKFDNVNSGVLNNPKVVNNYTNCSFDGNATESSYTRRPKIPVFDDSKIDLEAYLANFSAITRGWKEEDKLSALRQKLEGRAAKVLANLDLSGTLVTYSVLVSALEQHYIGERSIWMTKLRDVRREEGESLDDLAFRISLYSKRAYGHSLQDLGIQFYLALRDTPLGDKLYAFKDRKLEEILVQAKSYENHLLATNQAVLERPAPIAVAAVGSGSANSSELPPRNESGHGRGRGRGRGSTGHKGGQYNRYSGQDRRFDQVERRCYICKSNAHLWKECPYVQRHVDAQTNSSSPQQTAPGASNDSLNS